MPFLLPCPFSFLYPRIFTLQLLPSSPTTARWMGVPPCGDASLALVLDRTWATSFSLRMCLAPTWSVDGVVHRLPRGVGRGLHVPAVSCSLALSPRAFSYYRCSCTISGRQSMLFTGGSRVCSQASKTQTTIYSTNYTLPSSLSKP